MTTIAEQPVDAHCGCGVEDHDRPYAPMAVPFSPHPPDVAALLRLRLRETLAAGLGPLTVLGNPMRVLLPADRNPFPLIRIWGRR